jgi:hypothetical protein
MERRRLDEQIALALRSLSPGNGESERENLA